MRNGANVKKVEGCCKSSLAAVTKNRASDEIQIRMGEGQTE